MLIGERRAREARKRSDRRAAGPTAGMEPTFGHRSLTPFVLDHSALDGTDVLEGAGAFKLDQSTLDGPDRLVGGRAPLPDFQLDVTPLDNGGRLT